MQGLEKFKEYMSGFRSHYVVIGGLATVLTLEDRNLPARATKDVDMIIICQPEAKQYMKRFWEFIKAGGYKRWKPDDEADAHPCFYRFVNPEDRVVLESSGIRGGAGGCAYRTHTDGGICFEFLGYHHG